jgi:hypothetical protein
LTNAVDQPGSQEVARSIGIHRFAKVKTLRLRRRIG